MARLMAMAAAAATLSSCGGDDTTAPRPDVSGVGEAIGGSVAPLADCGDWRDGSTAERLATIRDIRGQLTPQTSPSEESGYPDEDAYELFNRVCAQDFASSFRLYKLYAQAAAFAPLRE